MTEELSQVQAGEGGVSSPVTETPNPSDSGVSQQPAQPQVETPAPQSPAAVDVEKLIAKYEQDIRQMKSSLQKREAQVNAEWQQRYNELQRQMHEVRMSRMTDEERKAYEAQLQSEEMRTLQEQLDALQNERNQFAQMMDGMAFFLQQGVPADKLVLNEGYDALVRSGWEYITTELNRLRQSASNPQPQPKPEPAPLKPAPSVVTDKGTPGTGTTWAALRAQYGSDEAVYRAVEEGRLPPTIIPT
jgi:hypothetical protein